MKSRSSAGSRRSSADPEALMSPREYRIVFAAIRQVLWADTSPASVVSFEGVGGDEHSRSIHITGSPFYIPRDTHLTGSSPKIRTQGITACWRRPWRRRGVGLTSCCLGASIGMDPIVLDLDPTQFSNWTLCPRRTTVRTDRSRMQSLPFSLNPVKC